MTVLPLGSSADFRYGRIKVVRIDFLLCVSLQQECWENAESHHKNHKAKRLHTHLLNLSC